MTGWLDARGCLTEAGFAAASASPLGQVPPELAAHLASCGRCQQRLLGGGARRPPVRPKAPSFGRMLLVLGGVAAAILALLFTLRHVAAPGP